MYPDTRQWYQAVFSFIFRGALQDLVLERSGRVEFRVSRVYSNSLLKPSSTNLQAPDDGSLEHFVSRPLAVSPGGVAEGGYRSIYNTTTSRDGRRANRYRVTPPLAHT